MKQVLGRWMTGGRGVMLASVLGLAVGSACHHGLAPETAAAVAAFMDVWMEAFLRLVQMIIAPLVFASLAAAIARMGSAAELGRIGGKALLWFLAASCLSLGLGLVMAHWLQPGAPWQGSSGLTMTDAAGTRVGTPMLGLADFMRHLIPRSIIEAMAQNEILQIVVFAVLTGTAAAELQARASRLVEVLEQLTTLMFKLTDYVMKAVPIAVFTALAGATSRQGLGLVGHYVRFVGGYYLALAVLWTILVALLLGFAGRHGRSLLAGIRQPVWLAFVSASSEAAYPRLLEALAGAGLPRRVVSFVLPLGYAFNLDGAMMYASFAVIFIAQAYGVELGGARQLALFGLLLISTKGLAGVPRAVIAVLAVTLHDFDLPDRAIALVLAVDHIMDMGRSATNTLGNAVAAVAISRWEGQRLDRPQDPAG
ncbi:dicarboxylate/amino acid:cation symporter [Frateuria aurantia]